MVLVLYPCKSIAHTGKNDSLGMTVFVFESVCMHAVDYNHGRSYETWKRSDSREIHAYLQDFVQPIRILLGSGASEGLDDFDFVGIECKQFFTSSALVIAERETGCHGRTDQ
jgi:hypothetical protein